MSQAGSHSGCATSAHRQRRGQQSEATACVFFSIAVPLAALRVAIAIWCRRHRWHLAVPRLPSSRDRAVSGCLGSVAQSCDFGPVGILGKRPSHRMCMEFEDFLVINLTAAGVPGRRRPPVLSRSRPLRCSSRMSDRKGPRDDVCNGSGTICQFLAVCHENSVAADIPQRVGGHLGAR